MGRIVRFIGQIFVNIIKAILWLGMMILKAAFELTKIFIMLFSIVFRIFAVFVEAGTP